jgi:hypothetical protein
MYEIGNLSVTNLPRQTTSKDAQKYVFSSLYIKLECLTSGCYYTLIVKRSFLFAYSTQVMNHHSHGIIQYLFQIQAYDF